MQIRSYEAQLERKSNSKYLNITTNQGLLLTQLCEVMLK